MRFIKKGSFLFILVLSMIVISACGSNGASQQETDAAGSGGEGSGSKETYTLKMATPSTPSDSNVMAFYEFEKIVEENSEGQIDVEVFDSGQLGGHTDYIDGLEMGNIQAAEISTSVLSGVNDKFTIFSMPYIAKSMEHMSDVINNKIGEDLSASLEDQTGMKIIGWMVRGPRNVYSSKGPIESPEDFQGLKVRVMESPVMLQAMELLGAKPTPISADERYMALQTGVVDAAENSVALVVTEKEYEVTDYVSLTEHFITPNVIALDGKFFDKLPSDLQQIVLDAGEEAAQFAFEEEKRQMEAAIETLKEKGMKINEIENKEPFVEKVKPAYKEYEDQVGKELFDAFLEG